MFAQELKPSSCLECVAGEMTGNMMNYLEPNGTCVLYGLLSMENAGNINPMGMIGKHLKLEGYILNRDMERKTAEERVQFMMRAAALYSTDLSTTVAKKFGLHQIKEAVQHYMENQTAGKVVLQPELTE